LHYATLEGLVSLKAFPVALFRESLDEGSMDRWLRVCCYAENLPLATSQFGLWSWVLGLGSLDFGLWTLDFGLWSLVFGLWTLDFDSLLDQWI
jgi:hypothetical protein